MQRALDEKSARSLKLVVSKIKPSGGDEKKGRPGLRTVSPTCRLQEDWEHITSICQVVRGWARWGSYNVSRQGTNSLHI